jgi:hypothetical protein
MLKRWLLLSLLAISLGSLSLAEAQQRDGDFFVPTGDRTGFGAFREGPEAAARLRRAFGPPSSKHLEGGGFSCVFGWHEIGVAAQLVAYGSARNPCTEGTFVEARLTDPRWHTASGVSPGQPKGAARKASLRRCSRHTLGCGVNGYALELHRTVCARTLSAGVIAHVPGDRVISLIVRWRSCE